MKSRIWITFTLGVLAGMAAAFFIGYAPWGKVLHMDSGPCIWCGHARD